MKKAKTTPLSEIFGEELTKKSVVHKDIAEKALEVFGEELRQKLQANDDPDDHYVPHLRAVHSRTRGYAQRVPSSFSMTRLHDLLSRGEKGAFLILAWEREKYRNVREQFSIPVGLTLAISALHENLPHPWFQGEPATLSVDLMASLEGGGWHGVDYKLVKDYEDPKSKVKLELVKLALESVGVTHEVWTNKDIPKPKVYNLRFLRVLGLTFDRPPLDEATLERIQSPLRHVLADSQTTIFEAACNVAKEFSLNPSAVARACYWFVANKKWHVDISLRVGPDYPLTFIQ